MLKKYLIAFTLCFLLLSCKKKETLPDKAPQNTAVVQETKPENLNAKTVNTDVGAVSAPRIPAVIKAENKSALAFQTSGVLNKIDVVAGDSVKKGQILASLDNTQEILDVKNAQYDLESKKLAYELAEKKYTRNLEQFKAGIISQGAIDNEKNLLESAKLNYRSSQTALDSKKYALKLASITAPFSGIISQSYKSLGDSVSQGTPVFDLVQSDDLSVYAQVPILYYNQIKKGMSFKVTDPLHQYQGEIVVKRVVAVIDGQSSTFDIYGTVKQFNRKLVPGEYMEILL